MMFDIRTLLVAVGLITALCTVARVLLWRMHPTVPGLLHWAVGSAIGTVAMLLMAGHAVVPHILSLSLAQVLIFLGLVVIWDGFRRFQGRQPLSSRWLAVTLLAIVVLVGIVDAAQSVQPRMVLNAVMITLLSGLIARELLWRAPAGRMGRVTAVIYVCNTAFFALRGLAIPWAPPTLEVPILSSGPVAYALLWWLCVSVATTLGMVLMASERLQTTLDTLASRDPLTGALNRRAFAVLADKEITRSRRHGRPLSVLMMDLDHFKSVNDTLGHAAGDTYLCRFAAVAHEALREDDSFARFGGEEFIALLPETAAPQALLVAERVRLAFAAAALDLAAETALTPALPITVSIGLADLAGQESLEDMIGRADQALYDAKHGGRNCCRAAPTPVVVPEAVPA